MRASIGSAIYTIADWLVRLSTINLLWFIFNLPIAFILFNMFFVPIEIGILYYLLSLVIFLPLLFYPSTIALFVIVRDWVWEKEEEPAIRHFFQSLKEVYKASIVPGIIFTTSWLIWALDIYYFYKTNNTLLMFFFIVIGASLFMYNLVYINMFVHFKMQRKSLFKNAFLMTFGRPFASVLMA